MPRGTAWAAGAALAALGALALAGGAASAARGGLTFHADEWVTECDPGGGACSITAPFWGEQAGHSGSFALVVMLQSDAVAVVGQPYPSRATLRVDKNPAIECRQLRYCLFPSAAARAVIHELAKGSLVLLDVVAGGAVFHFSLTPKGYQAGLAKIAAWGYRLPRAVGY